MYGLSLLKPRLETAAASVTCPLRGCRHEVPIQPSLFRTSPEYRCPLHHIYISATTFAYEREVDNLLWTEDGGLQLLNATKRVGSYGFMSHDNSERAVAWNVFRWLEQSNALGGLLEHWTNRIAASPQVTYWSHSPERDGCLLPLLRARTAFEEVDPDETTPAVVVETDDALFVIDPHLGPGGPSPRPARGWERYAGGGRGWADQVIIGDLRELSADTGRFDITRQWLIGTHMADQLGKPFVLVHLVPSWSAAGVFTGSVTSFNLGPERDAIRVTWEDLYTYVAQDHASARDANVMLTYMEEKSAGYGSDGVLRRAFALQSQVAACR